MRAKLYEQQFLGIISKGGDAKKHQKKFSEMTLNSHRMKQAMRTKDDRKPSTRLFTDTSNIYLKTFADATVVKEISGLVLTPTAKSARRSIVAVNQKHL